MANIRLTGQLVDPVDASPDVGAAMRFTHDTTTGETIKYAQSVVDFAPPSADYDFTLEYGRIVVEYKISDRAQYKNLGMVIVNSTNQATTIPELLNAIVPTTPDIILEMQAILANAQAAQAAAEQAAIEAEASAQSVTASAAQIETNRTDILDLSEDVVKSIAMASGGKLIALKDDNGNTNLFFRVPVCSYEDYGLDGKYGTGVMSCFDKGNGTYWDELLYAAVPASIIGGNAVSVPNLDPANNINYDESVNYCGALGAGYHLATSHEWACVSFIVEHMVANGEEQPKGNTYYGQSYDDNSKIGSRSDGLTPGDISGTARTKGGSGPIEWNHNGQTYGIDGLVGNLWEWVGGFKIVDGQTISSTFNNQLEIDWVPQACVFDAGNKLNSVKTGNLTGGSVEWNAIGKDASYVTNQLMKRMLIEPDNSLLVGRCFYNNSGERLPLRGGNWNLTSDSGLGAVNLNLIRSSKDPKIGFRFALMR